MASVRIRIALLLCFWCIYLSYVPKNSICAYATNPSVYESPVVNSGVSPASSGQSRWRSRSSKVVNTSSSSQSTSSSSATNEAENIASPLNGDNTAGSPGLLNSHIVDTNIQETSANTPTQQHYTTQMQQQQQQKRSHETNFVAECTMPTSLGKFRMRSYTYSSPTNKKGLEPIVVIHGDVKGRENVIVRVHDQCFTSEVFGSRRCDCREQLHESLKLIRKETGIVIYLQQEGRGIGLSNKVLAYSLQDTGMDTVDANIHLGFKDEQREYMSVPDILADLDIKSVRLITNNPFKIDQLTSLGVAITGRVSLDIPTNEHNIGYIRSKRDRMQHLFPQDLAVGQNHQNAESFTQYFEKTASALAGEALSGMSGSTGPVGASPSNSWAAEDRHQQPGEQEHRLGYAFGKQSVEAAIAAIKQGKVVVVVDDEQRENEGDLIMAAELATPDTIGFMVRHTSGVVCVGMESERLDSLMLPPMVSHNEDPKKTAYAVSVDCKHGTTTGISASDRAMTFRALSDPNFRAHDFQRPGHVFPLRARPGGVIVRAGHTEASVDLAKMAGLYPAGVLAEVVNDDGSIMRLPGLKAIAHEHGLVLTSVQDLIAYRLEMEGGRSG